MAHFDTTPLHVCTDKMVANGNVCFDKSHNPVLDPMNVRKGRVYERCFVKQQSPLYASRSFPFLQGKQRGQR